MPRVWFAGTRMPPEPAPPDDSTRKRVAKPAPKAREAQPSDSDSGAAENPCAYCRSGGKAHRACLRLPTCDSRVSAGSRGYPRARAPAVEGAPGYRTQERVRPTPDEAPGVEPGERIEVEWVMLDGSRRWFAGQVARVVGDKHKRASGSEAQSPRSSGTLLGMPALGARHTHAHTDRRSRPLGNKPGSHTRRAARGDASALHPL